MDVYCINGNLRHLLLVEGKHVINGAWNLARDKDGHHVPRNPKIRAKYLGKAPKYVEDEYGGCDYNAMLALAFDKFHLPLFDGPRTIADEARVAYYGRECVNRT